MTHDSVHHPQHYTSDPSGVEQIQITRHRNFNIGNAIKYLWRAGLKTDASQSPIEKQIEDLRKAVWYIEDEIARIQPAPEPELEVVGVVLDGGELVRAGTTVFRGREVDCS